MAIHITGAPCCWGVDDVKNPYLPPWQKVLYEAGQAGYKAIELGPYGYLPLDIDVYDAAEWSCLAELSERSAREGRRPVSIPDFTHGHWQDLQQHKMF